MPRTPAPIPMPDPKMWQLLVNLRAKRANEKNRIDELTKTRSVLEEDLANLGVKRTQERLLKATDHYDTEQSLKGARARVTWFSDQMDHVINEASQGRNIDVDGFITEVENEEPPLPLFAGKAARIGKASGEEDDGDQEGEESSEPAPERRRVGTGEPAWWAKKVGELGVSEHCSATLRRAGLQTCGDVMRLMRDQPDSWVKVAGLSPDQSEQVIKAVSARAAAVTSPNKPAAAPEPKPEPQTAESSEKKRVKKSKKGAA